MNPRKYEQPNLTVVLPVFNNAASLKQLCKELCGVLRSMELSFELLFVDDASTDASAEIIGELARGHREVSLLQMAGNVGQQAAILYGLDYACGECCVVMDADLQDPPAALSLLWAMRSNNVSAVFAGRRGRYQSIARHATSRLYKWAQHMLTKLPPDAGSFVLLERPLVQSLLNFHTRFPAIPMMIGCLGVTTLSIPIERRPRTHGRSKYRGSARLRAALKGVICVLEYRYWPARVPYLKLNQGDNVAAFRPASMIESRRKAIALAAVEATATELRHDC